MKRNIIRGYKYNTPELEARGNETDALKARVRNVTKRIFSVLCGSVSFGFALVVLACFFMGAKVIDLSRVGGDNICILNYQISLSVAFLIVFVTVLAGASLAYVFYYLAEKIWDSTLL